MDVYRLCLFAALAVVTGDAAGQCHEMKVHECLIKYTLQLVLRVLEGVEKVCSTRDMLKNATYRCIQEEARGCDVTNRKSFLNALQHLHASFYFVLERIICKPSSECSILQLLSCYGNLFQDLDISFPARNNKVPVFVDGLHSRMFEEPEKICRNETMINTTEAGKCMKDKMTFLFRRCTGPEPRSVPANVQNYEPSWQAGYREQPEKEVEGMIVSALGLLATPSAMARAIRVICSNAECVDYASRYTMVRNCKRMFVTESLRAINEDAIADSDSTCRSVYKMNACVARAAQNCTALSAPSPVNEPIQQLMTECQQRYSSTTPTVAPPPGVFLIFLILCFTQWTGILTRGS